jgi:group I intron endonuclease
MEERTVYIYGLWDPRDSRLRYIGKTVNLKTRLYRHLIDYDRGKITHCSTWVKGIVNDGLQPVMEVLEETTEDKWQAIERVWIAKAKAEGEDLTNMSLGGTGGSYPGRVMSEETKQKLSAKLKGRDAYWARYPRTDEQKAAISQANKGKKPRLGMKNTPEQNTKIGAANAIALKGRKISEEERQRLTEEANRRWARPGEREKARKKAKQRPRGPDGRFLPIKEPE